MMPEAMRKWEKIFQSVGDRAHNAKPSFPTGAISRKYTFQMILKNFFELQ